MKKFKKFVALTLAAMTAVSAMGITAMAADDDSLQIGDIVEYIIYSDVNSDIPLEGTEKIEYMKACGETPGTTFRVGSKEYTILEDYNVAYLGEVSSTADMNILGDAVARSSSVPTTQGYLPYSGHYGMYSYLYTNKYFVYSGAPSIGVSVTADQAQTLTIEWIDGRNNEAMDSKTVSLSSGGQIKKYAWAYDSEPFYIKFVNAGSGRISGDFTISLDQS